MFDWGAVLVSLAAAVILSIAVFGFAMGLPLAYLLVGWVVWVLTNHFVEIVEHRAVGGAGWAVFSLDTIGGGRQQIGLVLVALGTVVLGLRAWLIARGQPAAAASVSAAAIACAPAVAGLLAVTRSAPRALDPRGVVRAVAGLGIDYALCVALAAAAAALGLLAYERRGFLELFGAAYLALGTAFVLGAAIYDRRIKLGVHAPRSPEARAEAETRQLIAARRAALDHAYGIAAGGGVARSLAHLAAHSATESDPAGARLWMFHEVARWEDPRAAIELGTALAAELNAAGRTAEAAKVLVTCRYLADKSGKQRPR